MGIFDSIASRRTKTARTSNTGPATSSGQTPAAMQGKKSAQDDLPVATRASQPQTMSQQAAHIPTARIPSAQSFVTADNGYNAGPANYVQSTMKKKQMMDANRAKALDQAAKEQSMTRKQPQVQTHQVQKQGSWPNLPPYLDIPGRDLEDPAYHAMLSHLGNTKGDFNLLVEDFHRSLHELVKPHKAERRHLDRAGAKACEITNDFLSREWDIFVSVQFVWDASIDEGAFRFHYPQNKADRYKWAEQVKGFRWNQDVWDDWNKEKKRLGLA